MQTFYELLESHQIEKLVNEFYNRVYTNEVLAPIFKHTNREEVQDKQMRFLTQFLGGPMRYNEKYGPPRMRMRHLPHKITPKAKEEWLNCMKNAIDTLDLTDHQKQALYNCFPKLAQHMVNSYDK